MFLLTSTSLSAARPDVQRAAAAKLSPHLTRYPHHPECHHPACARRADRLFARHQARVRARRLARLLRRLPWSTEASWYQDGGSTACNAHYPLGVASHYAGQADSAGLPCGMSIRICLGSRCIVARVQDRGPYVGSRELDLNEGARDALGCPGVCEVRYGPA